MADSINLDASQVPNYRPISELFGYFAGRRGSHTISVTVITVWQQKAKMARQNEVRDCLEWIDDQVSNVYSLKPNT